MLKTLIILLLFIPVILTAQSQLIPYRIGNKFGLINEQKKIVLKADYDIIDFLNPNANVFIAYNNINNEQQPVSSLIKNGKVIIKPNQARNYFIRGDFFVSEYYTQINEKKDDLNEHKNLYSSNGKLLLENKKEINIVNVRENEQNMEDVLIHSIDQNNLFSISLFNKKQQKITSTLLNNIELKEFKASFFNDDDDLPKDELIYIYYTSDKKIQQLNIQFDEKTFKISYHGDVTIKMNFNSEESGYFMMPEGDSYPFKEKHINPEYLKNTTSSIPVIRSTNTKYYSNKNIEEIKIGEVNITRDKVYVVLENDKKGLKNIRNNQILTPIIYDKILKSTVNEFDQYVLEKDGKYGIYYNLGNEPKTIDPIFDYLSIIYIYEFGNKKEPLIKLYDKNNKFFSYANQNGEVYYQK